MPQGGLVHLLLEHALVDGADRVLGAAENLRAHALGLPERELRDRVADPALDPLRAQRDLVVSLSFAPLLRAVRISDCHTYHRDGGVDAPERHDAGDPATCADDHLAAYLLAQDAVRRSHVAGALGSDGRRLEPIPVFSDCRRRLVDDRVLRGAPRIERQIEARKLELDSRHVGRKNAYRVLEQLLSRLVTFEDYDRSHATILLNPDRG
jgi:hypothetical protein